jgi:hypothetical protein
MPHKEETSFFIHSSVPFLPKKFFDAIIGIELARAFISLLTQTPPFELV